MPIIESLIDIVRVMPMKIKTNKSAIAKKAHTAYTAHKGSITRSILSFEQVLKITIPLLKLPFYFS